MENTKFIFENYRKSILDDQVSTKILAELYLSIEKSESEISEALQGINVSNKIAELFTSGLIQNSPNGGYKITALGKLLLVRLDLAEYIVNFQLENFDISPFHREFLAASVISQASLDENYLNQVSGYLKLLKILIGSEQTTVKKRRKLLLDLLYNYIVGLDENLPKIGPHDYPKFIFSKARILDNRFEVAFQNRKPIRVDVFAGHCRDSLNIIRESNHFFFNKPHSAIWSQESARKTTFLRLINPAINQESDRTFLLLVDESKYQEFLGGAFTWFNTEMPAFGGHANSKVHRLPKSAYFRDFYHEIHPVLSSQIGLSTQEIIDEFLDVKNRIVSLNKDNLSIRQLKALKGISNNISDWLGQIATQF